MKMHFADTKHDQSMVFINNHFRRRGLQEEIDIKMSFPILLICLDRGDGDGAGEGDSQLADEGPGEWSGETEGPINLKKKEENILRRNRKI